jgi:zinc protease
VSVHLSLLGLTVLLPILAQPQGVKPRSYKDLKFPPLRDVKIPEITTFTLANGMKVYLLENRQLPLIDGGIRVRCGDLWDPAEKVGLADLTGRILRSGGIKDKTGDQIDEQLENLAASIESRSDDTSSQVSFSCLKENLDEVIGLFKEIVTGPEFRQDKIDLAKNLIRSSISRRNDSPESIREREFKALLYGKDTPYGWDIEYGTLERIQRDDLVAFYKRYYFPANTTLYMHGDFSASEMRKKIETLFSSWASTQPPVPAPPAVRMTPTPGVYLAVKKDVTQTNFAIGHLGGTLREADYPALEVMGDILGGGFTSRLFKRVRSDLGYAYNVNGGWQANYSFPGVFEISGGTKSESTVETLQAIREQIDKMRAAEVTDQELTTAKQSVLNAFVFNFEHPRSTLSRLLTYEYNGYPKDFLFQYQKAIAAVTKADILRVAKQYLRPDDLTYLVVGKPEEFGKPLSTLNLPVKEIDLNIPEPKQTKSAATPDSVAKGKKLLQLLQKNVGGADKLAAVKDYSHQAEVELQAGPAPLKVKQQSRLLRPYFRQDQQLPFGKISVYFDGKAGWLGAPQGVQPLPPAVMKQAEGEMFRHFTSLWLSDLDPDRTVNLVSPGVIEVSDKQGNSTRMTIDDKTGLLVKQVYRQGPNEIEETYSNWKPVDGIQLPFETSIQQGGKKAGHLLISEIKLNSGLKAEELGQKP